MDDASPFIAKLRACSLFDWQTITDLMTRFALKPKLSIVSDGDMTENVAFQENVQT